MKRQSSHVIRCQSGVAGAEMALIAPLLITLMFGAFELGYYFYNEHVLVKSVRDAARFAARQPALYTPSPCVAGPVTGGPAPAIDNVARYGKPTIVGTDKPKIVGWTNAVVVSISCPAIGTYSGIYKGMANVPVVTVSATGVGYPSLIKTFGISKSGLTLNASSESAVMGI